MHRDARLSYWARRQIVDRRLAGWPLVEIASQLNVSRATVSKWWGRYLADPGGDWCQDRSSRPRSCPHQTPSEVEAEIVALRQADKLGPARIGYRLGVRLLDGVEGFVPSPVEPAGLARPSHRPTGPPLREGPARGTGPCRHETGRPESPKGAAGGSTASNIATGPRTAGNPEAMNISTPPSMTTPASPSPA